MKLKSLFGAALGALALTSVAFADDHDKDKDHDKDDKTCAKPPQGPPNCGNTHITEKLAEDYLKALAQDQKQDASGQAKLDRLWAQFIKQGLIPAGTPNPLTYEGSVQDMRQDAKLNEKLEREFAKYGVPFTSPIT